MVAAYPTTPPAVPIPIPDITPVKSLPSPINLVAVMIPALGLSIVILPSEQIVAAVPTLTPPVTVETPVTFKVVPLTCCMVAIPTTFTLSNSVCPSTSKSPLASILPAKVDTPVILTSSKLVIPSTSKSPLASILPAKVDTPDTFVVVALSCTAVATPVTFNSSVVVPSTIFAPPARTLSPFLAVTIPIASTFLTSS